MCIIAFVPKLISPRVFRDRLLSFNVEDVDGMDLFQSYHLFSFLPTSMDRSSSRIKRVAGVLFEEDQRCMLLFLLIYRFETSEVDRCRICLDRTSLKTYQSESYHPKGGVWGDSSAILHRLFHR